MSKPNSPIADSENLELEEQFIIRFPEELGKAVRESIEDGTIHEKLTIQMDGDMRYGQVRMNNQLLHTKVVDLPTIVESYKTADKVNLYKTADISQMMICSTEPLKEPEKQEDIWKMREPEKPLDSSDDEDKENKLQAKGAAKAIPKVDETFLCPSGITPPTRNIRRRRLKNSMQEKQVKPAESSVLKEVKYLLRMDSEAVSVSYELVDDDGTNEPIEPTEQ